VTWTAYYATTADAFGTLAVPTRTQIATGTFTVNSTVTRYYAQISVPAAATTGIEIVFSVGAQTSGTWTIGDVDLVPGAANEVYHEQRPYSLELSLCQRYLPCWTSTSAVDSIGNAWASTTTNVLSTIAYPVRPRVIPTGITTSGATQFSFTNSVASVAASACVYNNNTSFSQAMFSMTTAATTALSPGISFFNNATAYIYFTGCEL